MRSLMIALEHLGQVVVAVELVLIGDASKGLDGFETGMGVLHVWAQPHTAART